MSRAKLAFARADDEEYPAAVETGNSESPSYEVDGTAVTSTQSFTSPETARQPEPVAAAPTPLSAPASPPAPVPDLLGDLLGLDNALVPVEQPIAPSG